MLNAILIENEVLLLQKTIYGFIIIIMVYYKCNNILKVFYINATIYILYLPYHLFKQILNNYVICTLYQILR